MLMTVFTAALAERPRAGAELARLAWTDGADGYAGRLAPAVRDQVIPQLRASGRMPAG